METNVLATRTAIVMWDIDGTLLAPSPDAPDLFREVVSQLGPAPARPTPSKAGKTDRRIMLDYLQWMGHREASVDDLLASLDDLSERYYSHHPRQLLPGTQAALELARELGATNVLLTGNTPHRARVKLGTSGLDLASFDWARSAFGDTESDRKVLAKTLAAQFPNCGLIVVGDTDDDEAAAQTIHAAFVRVCSLDSDRSTDRIFV